MTPKLCIFFLPTSFFSTHDLSSLIISLLHGFISFLNGYPVSSLEQTPVPYILPASSSSAMFLVWAKVIFLKYKSRLSKIFYEFKAFLSILFGKTSRKQKMKKRINKILYSIKLGKICSSKLQHMKNIVKLGQNKNCTSREDIPLEVSVIMQLSKYMCQILLSAKMRPFKCHTLVGGDLEIMKTYNMYKRRGEVEREEK